jgi:hypothetical protein
MHWQQTPAHLSLLLGVVCCVVPCRLPLSQASACMSLGMFLSLCFSAPGLEVFGRQLHSGFVRCARQTAVQQEQDYAAFSHSFCCTCRGAKCLPLLDVTALCALYFT